MLGPFGGYSCLFLSCPMLGPFGGYSCLFLSCPALRLFVGHSCLFLCCPLLRLFGGYCCLFLSCPVLGGYCCLFLSCPVLGGYCCLFLSCPVLGSYCCLFLSCLVLGGYLTSWLTVSVSTWQASMTIPSLRRSVKWSRSWYPSYPPWRTSSTFSSQWVVATIGSLWIFIYFLLLIILLRFALIWLQRLTGRKTPNYYYSLVGNLSGSFNSCSGFTQSLEFPDVFWIFKGLFQVCVKLKVLKNDYTCLCMEKVLRYISKPCPFCISARPVKHSEM